MALAAVSRPVADQIFGVRVGDVEQGDLGTQGLGDQFRFGDDRLW